MAAMTTVTTSAATANAAGKKKQGGATAMVKLDAIPRPSHWDARAALFDQLYEEQQRKYAAVKAPITITLPNGTTMAAESWVTCPLDIAKRLSNSLAEKVIVARVNDELWDLARPLEQSCTLELLDWDDKEAQQVFWHSSAHIMGYAMERVFDTQLSYGPSLDEGGFFYEGRTRQPVSEGDYASIEAAMLELVKQKMPYQRLVLSKEDALRMFEYAPYKSATLRNKVVDGATCTVYRCGMFIDPCRGPHVLDTGRIKAVAVTKNSSAYYQGKAENEVLQRVYGISFPKAAMLSEWQQMQEDAAKRDHRLIGRQQQLFLFNEVSPGSAFWLPHGARIYNTLIEFLRKQYRRRGFDEVVSPNIYSSRLWMVSGHWEKYADNMFRTVCEKEDYGLKPMNCPGHCIMFAMQPHSYKELPIRYADFGVLHRNELSGALTGLTRVRRFQQDDAHIFCRMDQVTDEIGSALQFLSDVYSILGFHCYFRLSTRPENKLGAEEIWDQAEAYLRTALNQFCGIPAHLPDPVRPGSVFAFDGTPDALKKLKLLIKRAKQQQHGSNGSNGSREASDSGDNKSASDKDAAAVAAREDAAAATVLSDLTHEHAWEENAGDGAFYGPKIDIVVEDALRRRHQCATIQLDFNLPNRFGLKYTLPTANEKDAGGNDDDDEHHHHHHAKHEHNKKTAAAAAQQQQQQHADPAAPAAGNKATEAAGDAAAATTAAAQSNKMTYESVVRELGIDLSLDANQARPVMIHRAIMGSLERSIAILCEHYGGEWPLWLSPRQVMVVPISHANNDYAKRVHEACCEAGFYADVDLGAATLDKKIRNAEKARYNFIFVTGQQEQEAGTVNVRARGEKRLGSKTQAEALQWLRELVDSYSLVH